MEKFSGNSCWKMERSGAGGGGPWKVARTDSFNCTESKMEMGSVTDDNQYHLMRNSGRSSSSFVSEDRLAVSPANSNSTPTEAIVFGHESSAACEGRLYRSDSVISPGGTVGERCSLPVPFHLHHYKPAGMMPPLPLCFPPMGRGEMGMVTAVRSSPFSPSQWRELEQQALIFKYMTAGIPVPSDLLLTFRKSLPPFGAVAGSSPYHHLPHTTLTSWSPFQMGYGGNVDPEPGRCRRTDGKKWRCSRDVVPDQKYCERHMHRGRHRGSRKPVEGYTATTTSTTSNLRHSSTSGRKDLSLSSADGNQFQHFSVQHSGGGGHGGPSPSATVNETKDCRYLNGIKGEDDILSAKVSGSNEWRVAPKYNGSSSSPQLKSLMGQQFGLMSEGNQAENFDTKQHQHSFLGVCSNRRYGTIQESGQEERPLRHFLDDWPRSDTEESSRSKQNNSTTQLSISIPSATNSWSPRGKLSLSPLKLTMSGDGNEEDPIGMDPVEMGLGVGMNMNMDVEERHDRPHSWIPIAWENNPIGLLGPLAEVLQSSTPGGNKPGLNLMEEDNNNNNNNKSEELRERQSSGSCFESSPTGVLQKTFGCVSDTNSAATSKTDSSSQIASS
ncbi:growth-regulating factor 1 isoform X1 [Cryptomeria japonica]|uniref:growth-regulating factor 1 isoform X1 n=1 Tax=Cryptomeria japonica TaxID=3369 RepID=UPI0027DA70FD|nr:growth-regulating factor 1 isoform X1 [Cryptomeria japonica]